MDVVLELGDIIVDKVTGEAGLLVYRYKLAEISEYQLSLWVWNIFWIGKNIPDNDRLQPWTEFGLINIIKTGTFKLVKNN